MDIIKNFGRRLREIRKSKGYNQSQLAGAIGIEANAISQLELGERLPKKENLEKLCKVLEIEPKDLFDFGHLKTKEELLKDITKLIEDADLKELQYFHKMIVAIREMK